MTNRTTIVQSLWQWIHSWFEKSGYFELIQFDVLQRNECNRQTPGLKGGSDDGKAVCNVWSHSDFVAVDAVLVACQQIYLPAIWFCYNQVTGMIVTSTDAIRVLQMWKIHQTDRQIGWRDVPPRARQGVRSWLPLLHPDICHDRFKLLQSRWFAEL